jgi:hypothetical protein
VIVVDTGAVIALLDKSDRHHPAVRHLYTTTARRWILPWAILPEVDYLLATHIGARAEELFLADLAEGAFHVHWGDEADLERASALGRKHKALKLGLVDGVVMAVAERLRAEAIVTLDVRHFGAVALVGSPKLLPRDL